MKEVAVDIYDNDAPALIVEPVGNGSTDVVEGGGADSYRVRLTQAPSSNVTVVADAVKTRTSWGKNAYFENQVTVGGAAQTSLLFTSSNWDQWQVVTVAAIQDSFIDGNDTQVFAPDLQTVNKIRGPLVIEGAAGAGSLSLPAPLMMPWERNLRESDGNVVAFVAATTPAGAESMDVEYSDLDLVVQRLKEQDPSITVETLIGKTLEMSRARAPTWNSIHHDPATASTASG